MIVVSRAPFGLNLLSQTDSEEQERKTCWFPMDRKKEHKKDHTTKFDLVP